MNNLEIHLSIQNKLLKINYFIDNSTPPKRRKEKQGL